ncbi:KAP family P-loop NTPase fold protein [Actinokineospora enzanensis]|uniref:KAP family P-loop NTPase fold protein n=1 Tax=Actinokineospora enzanensis TaxID=155975 RepID=UPI0003740965|nr:P-loop NTPase fold protein [Actinokineospora enzanensis]
MADLAFASPDSRVLLIAAGFAPGSPLGPTPMTLDHPRRLYQAMSAHCGLTSDRFTTLIEPNWPEVLSAVETAAERAHRVLIHFCGQSRLHQGVEQLGIVGTGGSPAWLPGELLIVHLLSQSVKEVYLLLETSYGGSLECEGVPSGHLLASSGSPFSLALATQLAKGVPGGPPLLTFPDVVAAAGTTMTEEGWSEPELLSWGTEPLPFAVNAAAADHGTERAGPVLVRGFGDRRAEEDLLRRGHLVSVLADLLRAPMHDGDDQGPTVITVEGPWGSGKSTLLHLMDKELRSAPVDPPHARPLRVREAYRLLRDPPVSPVSPPDGPSAPVVANFNPWRHQSSEQVWAGLARVLTRTVEDTVYPDADSRQRFWFTRNLDKIDRPRQRREIWRRIRSPLLAYSAFSLLVPLTARLLTSSLTWLLLLPAALLLLGVLHTAARFFFDRAAAFLPSELFHGPLPSGAFSANTPPSDPTLRDPYYHARSGYLYLLQHDIGGLLTELARAGRHLVVFVDDLDRCAAHTTAEVLEAINAFLSGNLPRTRFVLGLDPNVVAAHVDRAHRDLADGKPVCHPDDPSPGWTFLRKMVQLPVQLPRLADDDMRAVLDRHLGPEAVVAAPIPAVRGQASDQAPPADRPTPEPTAAEPKDSIPVERHPAVRAAFVARLSAQPERTVREEKRLITLWQFYLRVLTLADGEPSVARARDLVAVADLATRWPGYQKHLRTMVDDKSGLDLLADAVDDDLAWATALGRLGFPRPDEHVTKAIRALLRDNDAQAIARLARRLR